MMKFYDEIARYNVWCNQVMKGSTEMKNTEEEIGCYGNHPSESPNLHVTKVSNFVSLT